MDRRTERETLFKMLFETEFKKDDDKNELYDALTEYHEARDSKYVNDVYFGVLDQKDALDEMISRCARGWKLSRMSGVSLSIMRLSAYEMKELSSDIPFAVSINEAVELAKKYDEDSAPKFVNGVLNRVAVELGLK